MAMKNSKKLDELCHWEDIDVVNEKLDSGENPNKVHAWITSSGFKISLPMVYEYAKRRKQAMVTSILAEQYITPIDTERLRGATRVPIVKPGVVAVKRLKNELDALEAVIQLGYQSLCNLPAGSITPKLMMEAIDLKNKITEGAYANQTEFGIYSLKELENRKTKGFIEIINEFIPEDRRDEFFSVMQAFEDEFYIETDYYVDYLEAKRRGC